MVEVLCVESSRFQSECNLQMIAEEGEPIVGSTQTQTQTQAQTQRHTQTHTQTHPHTHTRAKTHAANSHRGMYWQSHTITFSDSHIHSLILSLTATRWMSLVQPRIHRTARSAHFWRLLLKSAAFGRPEEVPRGAPQESRQRPRNWVPDALILAAPGFVVLLCVSVCVKIFGSTHMLLRVSSA
jgi:hypothetical protein